MPPNDTNRIGDRLPSQDESDTASQLCRILEAHVHPDGGQCLRITGSNQDSTDIVITPALSRLLIELLGHIAKGDAVNLVPITKMLTTRQAADVLNVPLPHLLGLLKTSVIGYERGECRQRVKADDILEYKNTRDTGRAAALDELAKIDTDFI